MQRNSSDVSGKAKTGRDELNLAEFPLSIVGKRPPGNVKTLHFEDQVWDKSVRKYVARRLTITASDLLGLPTALDDEVLVGCIKLTKDQGLKNPKVLFTPYEFLELLGWTRDGRSYKRLSQSLDRWAGTLVISDNAFWHKGRQKWVKDTINIIDRAQFYGGGEADPEHGNKSWFVWGTFMWESFQAGNLRSLDFEFWKSLNRPVSKRLFRLLQKRFYHRGQVTFPLRTLAFEKVGLSRNMHTGQIKAKLKSGHEELKEKGFCNSEYVSRGRGDWEVVYTDIRKDKLATSSSIPDPLCEELLKRGVTNGAELVSKHSRKRIQDAIENYDDRIAHGEDLGPGWLGSCVVRQSPYSFRKGHQTQAERKAEAMKLQAAERKNASRRCRQKTVESEEQEIKDAQFAAFLESLEVDGQLAEFRAESLEQAVFKDYYNKSLKAGNSEEAQIWQVRAMKARWCKIQGK